MKKLSLYLFIILGVWAPESLFAQVEEKKSERSEDSYYHQKGSHLLSIDAGLITNPAQFSFDLLTGGSGSGNPTPAVNVNYEYGITPRVGLGAFVGYYRVDAQQEFAIEDLLDSEILDDPTCFAECLLPISLGGNCDCNQTQEVRERINVLTVAGKLTYHFIQLPKLDSYSTVTLGYSFNRRKTIVEEALDLVLDEVSPNTNVPSFVYSVRAGIRYYFLPNLAGYGELGYSNAHLLNLGVSYRW